MATVTTTLITIALFIGAVAWVFWIAYWMLGRFGIWKWATFRRLSKRFKMIPLNPKTVQFCLEKIKKGYSYKDMRVISKYELNRGEILYTYLLFMKMPREELQQMIERRIE